MSRLELKQNLKELAGQIRENKKSCKDYQREHGGYDGNKYFTIYKLKHEYRHKHIAYCLLRGIKYEEIENYCADSNKPNFDRIKEVMDEHAEKVQDVCACA